SVLPGPRCRGLPGDGTFTLTLGLKTEARKRFSGRGAGSLGFAVEWTRLLRCPYRSRSGYVPAPTDGQGRTSLVTGPSSHLRWFPQQRSHVGWHGSGHLPLVVEPDQHGLDLG